jgi:hypothetical protein
MHSLLLYLPHSYARAPLRLNRLLPFIKSFLPIPNLLGVHQKVTLAHPRAIVEKDVT